MLNGCCCCCCFVQLLINYANDKLQYFFTQTAISLVMREYREEGIDTSSILSHFNDVSPTLALVEGWERRLERLRRPSRWRSTVRRPEPVGPHWARMLAPDLGSDGPSNDPRDERVCLLSLLDDDTRYSERAQQRDDKLTRQSSFTKASPSGGSRDDKFVKRFAELLGHQSGFVTSHGRRWDAAQGVWVSAEGYDRKAFTHAHFAIAHFGATVPCAALHRSERAPPRPPR